MSSLNSRQVQTTSWPKRHSGTFSELADWITRLDVRSPTVLEVGPGAMTGFLGRRLRAGEGRDLSWCANRWRATLRNMDSILRRIPWISLHSYEPGELLEILPAGSQLIVTDISHRVIETIRRQYPQAEAEVFDFAAGQFSRAVDVVVCLCVLVRAERGKEMFANLYRSLRPGGLMVMDNRSCTNFGADDMRLEKVAGQIWRKPTD